MTKHKQYKLTIYIIVSLFSMHYTRNVFSQVRMEKIIQLMTVAESVNNLDSINVQLCFSVKDVFLDIEKYGLCSDVNRDSIYKLIHSIYNSSLKDDNYIYLLIELDIIIKKNAEIGQYLSELQHKIALNNTNGFVRVYESLPIEIKENVKSNLSWLVENDKQQLFINKLDSLESKQKKAIVELKELFKE